MIFASRFLANFVWRLPIRPSVEPALRVGADEGFAHFIVRENQDGPRQTGEPVKNVQRTRAEHFVEDGRIAQGRTEDGFEDQTKVHEVVTHALFED